MQVRRYYPPLRQVPRLAVQYADLFPSPPLGVQETLFEMLTSAVEAAHYRRSQRHSGSEHHRFTGFPEKKRFRRVRYLYLLLLLLR